MGLEDLGSKRLSSVLKQYNRMFLGAFKEIMESE
jgi:hypothetical protein